MISYSHWGMWSVDIRKYDSDLELQFVTRDMADLAALRILQHNTTIVYTPIRS